MNPAGLAMLEADSVSQVRNRTLLDFIVPNYRDAFVALHKRVMSGEKDSLEFEVIGLLGTHRWLETHAAPLRDETGEITMLLGVTRDISLRKQAEKALRASKQRLALVIKGSNDAPWDWDIETKEMYYSPQWWQMLGYRINELPADDGLWIRLLHPDDLQTVNENLDQVLQSTQEIISYEFRLKHKDGQYVPVLIRGFISRDETGKPIRVSGTNMDLTERNRAREQEDLQIFLLELLTGGGSLDSILNGTVRKLETLNPDLLCSILLVDNEGHLKVRAAPSFPDLYNQAINDLSIAVGAGSCGKALDTGKRTVVENFVSHPYWGAYKELAEKSGLISFWSEPIFSREANVLGVFVIYHRCPGFPTIHNLKLIEMAAHFIALAIEHKRSEAHLKLAAKVFEQSNEGFMITDAKRKIIMVNHAFTGITGYTEAEVLGQTSDMLSSGHHEEIFYQNMWAAIQEKGYWQGEIWNRRKNGDVYPELLNVSVVRDSNGKISEYVGVFADITQIKTSERRLEFLAHHDPLTSLPNRLLLFLRLEHGIDVAKRENKQLALLMLDLDHFKDVNDSLGHLAGDQLLKLVAERLTDRLRETDTVARLGGDEFTVLLEDIAHPEDAARLAETIISDLSEPWLLPQGCEVTIGVSIGISLYPQYGDTPEMLLQQADTALYQAKRSGRKRFAYFSDELTHAVRERIALETKLRRAIAHNELRVFYQPQIEISSGEIVGAEALVRWQDPVEGLIPPIRFIPIAEQTGLILAIGEWVLRETCRQGREWMDSDLPSITLAVNVSPHQLRQGDINGLVATVLTETGFPAERLELELTESGLMERDEEAVELLNSLRAQGIRLAIDDFGTGYSSLAYLKRFPLDVLKIDKSFIDEIPYNQDDMEIAATIVAMGHTLGFKVLAEGVETREQLAFLKAQGCDLYQGYLSSRPVPAADFFELLLSSQHQHSGEKSLK
jgi:diguanylate cyclase (GGDEF)-like protein/PAS domain S-box-containing protein